VSICWSLRSLMRWTSWRGISSSCSYKQNTRYEATVQQRSLLIILVLWNSFKMITTKHLVFHNKIFHLSVLHLSHLYETHCKEASRVATTFYCSVSFNWVHRWL
jgi:hypothetical protein